MIKLQYQVKTFRGYWLLIFIYLLSSCRGDEVKKPTLAENNNQEVRCNTSKVFLLGCAKVKLGISFDCIQQMNDGTNFRKNLESSTKERSIYYISFGSELNNECLTINNMYGLGMISLYTNALNNELIDSISVSLDIPNRKINKNTQEIIKEINSNFEGVHLKSLDQINDNTSSPSIIVSESNASGAFKDCLNIRLTYK